MSNVPAVMRLKSLVSQFANTHSAWLTLAMTSTLAGNLTITGSVAKIIVVERAQKEAVITFLDYFRIGLPVTLLTLLVGWLCLPGFDKKLYRQIQRVLGSKLMEDSAFRKNSHHARL